MHNTAEALSQNVLELNSQPCLANLEQIRHNIAMAAFRVEQLLSEEIDFSDYPTTVLPEVKALRSKVFKIMTDVIDELPAETARDLRYYVEEAIREYLGKKVESKRAEIQIKRHFEKQGIDYNSDTAGEYLFYLRTGKKPQFWTPARREDAYWVIEFADDDDRLLFEAGKRNIDEAKKSGGTYHGHCRLEKLAIDVMTIPIADIRVRTHERQHFLNHEIYRLFASFESRDYVSRTMDMPALEKALNQREQSMNVKDDLRKIKDEAIAYIRDGSFSMSFIELELYSDLLQPFHNDERQEIILLMQEIDERLKSMQYYFEDNSLRAFLVYNLMDTPLTRFLERLARIKDFYEQKCKALNDIAPKDLPTLEQCGNSDDAYLDITGLGQHIYYQISQVYPLAIGMESDSISLDEALMDLISLRQEYDEMCAEQLGW